MRHGEAGALAARMTEEEHPMIQQLPGSSGNALGFKMIGTIEQDDYDVLVPAMEAAADEFGTVRLLCDLTEFHWEKASAWDDDMRFGREFRDKIEKMAIIGDRKWEEWLVKLAEPFYAKDAKYFDADESSAAWEWLRE
jgi:hypothetical protein